MIWELSAQERIETMDEMRRETEGILASSARLIAEMKAKLEDLRRLRAAHEALLKR